VRKPSFSSGWAGTGTLLERVGKESAQDASGTRLRMILERAPIGIIINDPDYRYTYWNPLAESIFGYKREEVLGKKPVEVTVPPEKRASVISESMMTKRLSVIW